MINCPRTPTPFLSSVKKEFDSPFPFPFTPNQSPSLQCVPYDTSDIIFSSVVAYYRLFLYKARGCHGCAKENDGVEKKKGNCIGSYAQALFLA